MNSPFAPPMGPPPTPEFLAQTRAPEMLFGSIFPVVIATVFVFGRFYSRMVIMRSWGWDDTWILISWLLGTVGLLVLNIRLIQLGSGKHMAAQKFEDLPPTIVTAFVSRLFYQIALFTTRMGICAFYLRIFQEKKYRRITWAIIMFNILYAIPLVFISFFRCRPVSAVWTLSPTSKCIDDKGPMTAAAVLNVLSDVILLVFITPQINRLQLPRRQKNFLLGVVFLSIIVVIAAIVRYIRLIVIIPRSKDISYDSYDLVIWSSVEVNTGIFCASAPSIKPLIKRAFPRLVATFYTRTGKGTTTKGINTYNRSSRLRSIRDRNDAIELSSQADLDLEKNGKNGSSEAWASVDSQKGWLVSQTNMTDTGSEEMGLPNGKHLSRDGDIIKTVQVTVLRK